MKYEDIKKRTLAESGVLAVALIIVGGALYALSVVSDSYQQEMQQLMNEVNGIGSETNVLQEKYLKIQRNAGLYEEILRKKASNDLYINRRASLDKFNQFRDRFYLGNIYLSLGALQELKGNQYQRKADAIVSSDVTIGLSSLTDEDIYNFMDGMNKDLTGSVRINKFSLSRQAALNEGALREIGQKGVYALIKGDITFSWFGLRQIENSEGASAQAKPQ